MMLKLHDLQGNGVRKVCMWFIGVITRGRGF